MSTRRHRVRPLLPATALVLLSLLPLGTAAAQEPRAEIALVRQTPWVEVEEPSLAVEVRARNDGEAELADLALRTTMYTPAFSRSDLELALVDDPGDTTVVRQQDVVLDGSLAPGQERVFAAELSLAAPELNEEQSYVYPLRFDLISGGSAIATIRSAVVVLVRDPLYPLGVQTGVQLLAPLLRGPDGVFTDTALEDAVATGGSIATAVDGLRDAVDRRRPFRADLSISPLLLLQLEDMTDGYRVDAGDGLREVEPGTAGAADAAEVLRSLGEVAASSSTRVTASTLAGATLPSLRGPLARDLEPQLEIGGGVIERVLGAEPSPRVTVPRRSAIDADSLERVVARGIEVVLVTPLAVPPVGPTDVLTAPPTVALPAGRVNLSAIVATQSLQNLVTSDLALTDPVLAAQQTLAMAATVWLEQPGIDGRTISLLLPETAPGTLVAGIASRFASAPFLHGVNAGELAASATPGRTSGFQELDHRGFGASYVDAIRRSRRRIDTYRSMLVEPSPLPTTLSNRVLLSEGAEFLDDPEAGLSLLASVDARVDAEMGKVRPGISPVVTLTSRNGRIPLTVSNSGAEPVSVRVGLRSPQLETTAERDVNELEPGETRDIVFDVRLKTTGQFPLRVVVEAPTGRPVSETTVIVRSTAYSRIALIITVGAALALVLLWARRFFRRTSS